VSADQRVTAAREYLAYARQFKLGDLPNPTLVRLAAELRKFLGQVLDAASEMDATAGHATDMLQEIETVLDAYVDSDSVIEDIRRVLRDDVP
jgi:hypothetical protein